MQFLPLLSDHELVVRTEQLAKNERKVTEQVVRHFAEILGRRIYAKLGYSSLFDFATKGLHYSSSSALRRIKAAKVAMKAPRVLQHLQAGSLNLSTIDVLARFCEEDDIASLAENFCGKSKEEVEMIAARRSPVSPYQLRD